MEEGRRSGRESIGAAAESLAQPTIHAVQNSEEEKNIFFSVQKILKLFLSLAKPLYLYRLSAKTLVLSTT